MSVKQADSLRHMLRLLLLAVLIAPTWLHAAADVSPLSARFVAGWQAYQAGDHQRAAAVWSRLAHEGHADAQVNLGVLYDAGRGVQRDHRLAAHWYRAAAVQRSAAGQYNLALLISDGHAEAFEGRSARYWLQQAAAQGFEEAVRRLAGHDALDASGLQPGTGVHPGHAAAATGTAQNAAYDVIEVPVSIGTAWPVASGYAVTNHHVVDGKQQVRLINHRGDELSASVIASDPDHDVAFLRVTDPHNLPPALPLSARSAGLGASVFTIGFPRIDIMGKSPKLSRGIISSVNGLRDNPSRYQISVPIQQGTSGGPLLNMRGEVVGMITAMLGDVGADGGPAQPIPNIGFALKIDIIKQYMDRIAEPPVDIRELRPAASDLEDLAARVQDSVLIVMAE